MRQSIAVQCGIATVVTVSRQCTPNHGTLSRVRLRSATVLSPILCVRPRNLFGLCINHKLILNKNFVENLLHWILTENCRDVRSGEKKEQSVTGSKVCNIRIHFRKSSSRARDYSHFCQLISPIMFFF